MIELKRETIELIKQIYSKYPTGGALHIVLDDDNVDESSIRWCLENAMQYEEYTDDDRALFELCANNLLKLGSKGMRLSCVKKAFKEMTEENNMEQLILKWRERGRKILDKKYWEKWDEIVPIRLDDLYHGMELGSCLEIVEPLNNGCTFEEAEKIIDNQNHSGWSYELVLAMVVAFCDRGKKFRDYVIKR